tara:strand:+ start:741 stop:1793 length:1053 start_codon:yes stop_codon:yes gene_type:complete
MAYIFGGAGGSVDFIPGAVVARQDLAAGVAPATTTFNAFTGGTAPYAYAAVLSKPSGSGASVSGSGLGAYTWSSTANGEAYSLTLTATDDNGNKASSTADVTIAASAWTTVDLSAATVQDPNSVFDTGSGSWSLGTTSQVVMTDGYAGSVESNSASRGVSEIPAFVFRVSTSADVFKDYAGISIRVVIDSWPTATTTRYWRMVLGVGDSNTNIVDDQAAAGLCYLSQSPVTGKVECGMPGNTFTNGTAPDDGSGWTTAKTCAFNVMVGWSDDTAGQTGPEGRSVIATTQRLDQTDGSIAASVINPPSAWATGNVSIFLGWDINNTGVSARPDAGTMTNVELSYRFVERPV